MPMSQKLRTLVSAPIYLVQDQIAILVLGLLSSISVTLQYNLLTCIHLMYRYTDLIKQNVETRIFPPYFSLRQFIFIIVHGCISTCKQIEATKHLSPCNLLCDDAALLTRSLCLQYRIQRLSSSSTAFIIQCYFKSTTLYSHPCCCCLDIQGKLLS